MVAIGVQVTIVLMLVGLSRGMLEDQQRRAKGVGADILVRAPGSSLIGFSTNMNAKYLDFIRQQPHVRVATAVLVQATGGLNSVTGLDLPNFNALSGGFHYLSGGAFNGPDQIVIDQYYANQYNLKVGDAINVLNRSWKIVGIVEPGMLAREVVPLTVLQDLTANTGKVTMIYVKLDDPARTNEVVAQLRQK